VAKRIGPLATSRQLAISPLCLKKQDRPVFEAQCIPTDVKLLDVPSYKAFLGERRQIVAQKLNDFLGTQL
jgi:hypothetical protein